MEDKTLSYQDLVALQNDIINHFLGSKELFNSYYSLLKKSRLEELFKSLTNKDIFENLGKDDRDELITSSLAFVGIEAVRSARCATMYSHDNVFKRVNSPVQCGICDAFEKAEVVGRFIDFMEKNYPKWAVLEEGILCPACSEEIKEKILKRD